MSQDLFVCIPDTDLKLFRLGYGAVEAGGTTTDRDLFSCIDCYKSHGGNVLDTARVYAGGHSEEALGRYFAAAKNRSDFIVVSKGGHPPLNDIHQSRLYPNEVEADLNASLKALNIDCIDLYFLHRDDESQPVGNLIDMLEVFVKQGKIRYYGCSNYSAKRMAEADSYSKEHNCRGFIANEMFYNVASNRMNPFPDDTLGVMDDAMYEYHRNTPRNLAMPYFSVCSGFFHKLMRDPSSVTSSPYYTQGNLKVFERLNVLMEKYQASLSQLQLAFYNTCDFATVPLYGTGKVANLEDALGFLDLTVTKDDFKL